MVAKAVGIRIDVEGKERVVAAFKQIGDSGDASAKRLANAYDRAGRDAEDALTRQQRTLEKMALIMPGLNPQKLDMFAGVQEGVRKNADTSAATFEAYFRKLDAEAERMVAAFNPAFAAQQRFNNETARAKALLDAGSLSAEHYAEKIQFEERALAAVVGQHGRVAGSSNGMRTAMAGASYQVQDFVTQVSMGANPIQAFVVQGGQLAGQFQFVEGKAASVAKFFMGGWGLALQIGLMAAAPLISKLWEGGDASDAMKGKVMSLADALSRERFATDEARKALEDYNKAKADATAGDSLALDMSLKNAAARLKEAIATREQTKAKLEALGAIENPNDPLEQQRIGAQSLYQSQLDEQQRKIALLGKTLANLYVDESAHAEKMVDPLARINDQFDRQRDAAIRAASGNVALSKALAGTRQEIERNRQAALKAEQERQSAAREAERDGRRASTSDTLSASAVAAMLRKAIPGVSITSTTRSAAHNKAVGGVPTSYHVSGNAVDFVPRGGMASMTKEDVRRIFTSRGIDVLEVLGPGDKGHSDHFHVAWVKGKLELDNFNASAKLATDAQRELAKAQRELDGDLADVVRSFDPARAAADDYLATLTKLDKLVAGGRLSAGDALGYTLDAYRKKQEADATAARKRIQTIFGTDDPIQVASGKDLADEDKAARENNGDEDVKRRITDLAGFFNQAFDGGTRSIWGMFEQQGRETLAKLLAQWAIGKAGTGGIGGVLSSIIGLFGIGKNAAGTEWWSGGMSLVGENGPELVSMPRGSRVTPAAETRRLLGGSAGGAGRMKVEVVPSPYFDVRVSEVSAPIAAAHADGAAIRGAVGGSQMAVAEVGMQGARRLGRRW